MRNVFHADALHHTAKPPLAGHLNMGGTHPSGEEIAVNSQYLLRGGKPWLPVMGEFHFSRFPNRYWEEELLKMKAGGVQIVATYVFWIHHEEIEGRFDWTEDKDLRRFVRLCGRHGLDAVIRIGPWAHGECRNGGFPDWIYGKGCALRTNDEDYLVHVRKLYGEIARQLHGLAYQDGGPIVGIQFDNELTNNAEHLGTLKEIALEAGIRAPLYTVTGWGGPGGAKIPQDEVLPLFGGYPDHPWEKHTKPLPPGPHYFFHPVRNDPGIGNDLLGAMEGIAGDLEHIDRYPNGTCELGGGVQITYHRRPVISADDLGAMATVRIANGCNLLGYYMFHGGSHPVGELTTMQESDAHGNQLPVFSYDFQAPIGEFGFIRESYRVLKRLHLFVHDFGQHLATMSTVFPEARPSSFDDTETLRFAARVHGDSGYAFFNNYQRLTEMPSRNDVQIELRLPGETLKMPVAGGFTLERDAYFFWPFNMDMEGILLKYATAQPLCKLANGGETVYVFFEAGGVNPEYVLEGGSLADIEANEGNVTRLGQNVVIGGLNPGMSCEITLRSAAGAVVKLLTLTGEQSLHVWKGRVFGQDRLVWCESNVAFSGEEMLVSGIDADRTKFAVYPPVEYPLVCRDDRLPDGRDGSFQTFAPRTELPRIQASFSRKDNNPLGEELFPFLFEENGQEGKSPEWEIRVDMSALDEGAHDIALTVDFVGDVAQAYVGGRCVADQFYSGVPWKLGLKRYRDELANGPLVLKISPLRQDRDIYLQERPSGERLARLTDVRAEAEFRLAITSGE